MTIFKRGDDGSKGIEIKNNIIIQLNAELDEILLNHKLTLQQIDELTEQLNAREATSETIERSLIESQRIAEEMETEADIRIRAIMADAQRVLEKQQEKLLLIDKEIAYLNKELNPGYVVVEGSAPLQGSASLLSPVPLIEGSIPKVTELETSASFPEEIHTEPAPPKTVQVDIPGYKPETIDEDSNKYSMQLVAFVNARHFVSFGGKDGPIHAHSWQAQIEVQVPIDKGEVMGFAKISSAIKEALAPYENIIFNYSHPFNKIQPTTENLAMYFFNCLEDALRLIGLDLDKMTLWETPTRGIQVTTRNTLFDDLTETSGEAQENWIAQQQAAPTKDTVSKRESWFGRMQLNPAAKLIPRRPNPDHPVNSWQQYAVAICILSVATFLIYHNILFAPFDQRYPWGSDTWGHLFKADYLYNQILQGNYYPQFTEYWYNGVQPFRYWAPLPYYVLAFFEAVTGDIFTAGNIYLVTCAFLGSMSCLMLSRYMGIWPAIMVALLWLVWQDNVRVAFSEGNVSWVLATAFLPSLFISFLKVMGTKKSYLAIIATVILIHIAVLSHAMIGAVYFLCFSWFLFFLWIFGGCSLKEGILGVFILLVGVGTSAWWLLPSLTGGISGLDVDAVKEAIQFVPASISFNPLYRFSYPENFYWGISIIFAIVVSIITWRSKPAWAKSLTICGIMLVIFTFPFMKPIYTVMPLCHLLWPLRFTGFAAFALMVAAFTFNLPEFRQNWMKSTYTTGLIIFGLFAVFMVDCLFSVNLLVHTSTNRYSVLQSINILKKNPGWRVAAIDLSQLGSAPSYAFSQAAGMEQIFGWAWQGAVTSRNIMLLNTGLEFKYYPFLFRSCVDMGATDLVVKNDVLKDRVSFYQAAIAAGYKHQETLDGISIWHSVDYPYLVEKRPIALVIGRNAGTITLQFPNAEMGSSYNIDKYTIEQLKQYPLVILSGTSWTSKTNAEKLITDYVNSGGKVVIELAGMPENVLAKQPEFLGVYGEPVTMRAQIALNRQGQDIFLQPFSDKTPEWKAYVPMGLDEIDISFSYYGNKAPVYGYKLINGKKVAFLGFNIPYHSFLTYDPNALNLIKEIFGLQPGYTPERLIPLKDYQASNRGYSMTYHLDRDINAILPIAALDGIQVQLDGVPCNAGRYENLLELKLPAGDHKIDILFEKTPVYKWGAGMSGLFTFILISVLVLIYFWKKSEDEQ